MKREFTTSCYIIQEEKVLLLLHPKLGKWLPPGGHLEENELPTESARREVLEETGLEIRFLRQENIWIERWNAESFERPYLCLLENIPPHKGAPAHQHVDLVYLAEPTGGHLEGADPLKWFSLEEVDALKGDEEIFVETQQTIRQILEALPLSRV